MSTTNPFSKMASASYTREARALASAFSALHILGHDSEDQLTQLWAACRAIGTFDRSLYHLGGFCDGAFFSDWHMNVCCDLDPDALPELQELANEFLESQAAAA